MKKVLLVSFFLFLLLPSSVLATIGVGVGTGKIQVDQKLKPGVIYNLPSLTVLNTGDEPSEYEVSIEYHEKQKELMPERSWFDFSPRTFSLNPGEAKEVKIKLNLPVRTKPGDYFAYLEGHPVKKSQSGTTSIGVAAATKLYFTVVPGNIFEGLYYKTLSVWDVYSPWPQVIVGLIVLAVLVRVVKRFFNIEIGLKKPTDSSKGSQRSESNSSDEN